MNPLNLKHAVAALLPLFASEMFAANPNVTVQVNALGSQYVIRNDITRTTFGSGIEHQTYKFRDVMATATNTQTAIKNMNMGTMRFPQGTTALFYYWDQPGQSYISRTPVVGSQILTPAEIIADTLPANLNMERLFQVNTYKYRSLSNVDYPVITPSVSPATIHTVNMQKASLSAKNWVANNLAQTAANRVTYWEVGNEDWNTWTPAEYTTIFNQFATDMKAASTTAGIPIKLLAQSFTGNIAVSGKPNNDNTWLQGMINAGIQTADVYALSEHEYLSTTTYPGVTYAVGRELQTKDMLAKVANDTRISSLKQTLANNGLNWKIWMTEFNAWPKGPDGTYPQELQDMGQALVIADWTGKQLEQGVERLFMHSLDDNPYFSQINYLNHGTVAAPRITAPGYAFAKYAQEIGPKLVTNTITGNVTLTSPNNGSYPQVAVYSSVRESDAVYGGYPALRVMVINRSTVDGANLTITTLNRPIAGASKNYSVQTLSSANLTDWNQTVTDYVKWSTPVVAASNTTGITATVPKLSATLFIIPLQ